MLIPLHVLNPLDKATWTTVSSFWFPGTNVTGTLQSLVVTAFTTATMGNFIVRVYNATANNIVAVSPNNDNTTPQAIALTITGTVPSTAAVLEVHIFTTKAATITAYAVSAMFA